ncbi:MAG TPA: UDP-N-acetylmuramoyl-L-alanine--D-glutamate ligase [Chloroflexota bacterium]
MMEIAGKRALILGVAREGVALAEYLCARGAVVTVTDSADGDRLQARLDRVRDLHVRIAVGGDRPELVDEADIVFVSPGVPENNTVYMAAERAGLPIESMTTLFFELCPGRIVGITGSSGKTTTTGLVGHVLQAAGRDVVVGGNIGEPMLDLLPRIFAETIVVLELSSFQLALLRRSPHIAVVTNISPNHLDRHGTMEAYIAAKLHIVEHQSGEDFAVLNADDAEHETFASATRARARWFGMGVQDGATVCKDTVTVARAGSLDPVLPVAEIPLLGRHNVENVMAAVVVADILGVAPGIMAAAIRTFRPAPHRLELVAERDGVRYIDDSIATSPARAQVALEAIDQPIVLIAGGRDKRLPWEAFARVVSRRVRVLLLIGEAAPIIEEAVRCQTNAPGDAGSPCIVRCGSLGEAVAEAHRLARPGEVVLLSPACTSYDMFTDFEERGRMFARAVEALDAA